MSGEEAPTPVGFPWRATVIPCRGIGKGGCRYGENLRGYQPYKANASSEKSLVSLQVTRVIHDNYRTSENNNTAFMEIRIPNPKQATDRHTQRGKTPNKAPNVTHEYGNNRLRQWLRLCAAPASPIHVKRRPDHQACIYISQACNVEEIPQPSLKRHWHGRITQNDNSGRKPKPDACRFGFGGGRIPSYELPTLVAS